MGTLEGSRKDAFAGLLFLGVCLRYNAMKGPVLASRYLLGAQDFMDMEADKAYSMPPRYCAPEMFLSPLIFKDLNRKHIHFG